MMEAEPRGRRRAQVGRPTPVAFVRVLRAVVSGGSCQCTHEPAPAGNCGGRASPAIGPELAAGRLATCRISSMVLDRCMLDASCGGCALASTRDALRWRFSRRSLRHDCGQDRLESCTTCRDAMPYQQPQAEEPESLVQEQEQEEDGDRQQADGHEHIVLLAAHRHAACCFRRPHVPRAGTHSNTGTSSV